MLSLLLGASFCLLVSLSIVVCRSAHQHMHPQSRCPLDCRSAASDPNHDDGSDVNCDCDVDFDCIADVT